MNTNGPNAILVTGTFVPATLRLTSSTLISGTFSINNTSLIPLTKVVIQQSIANMPTSNITQVPLGTLVIDPAII